MLGAVAQDVGVAAAEEEGNNLLHYQSLSSNLKSSFTGTLKILESRRASMVDGTYFPSSIELMVCRLTPTISANLA